MGIKEVGKPWAIHHYGDGGGMLYTLEETGRTHQGKPEMQNGYMVTIQRQGSVTKEQADDLLKRLHAHLNSEPVA